MTKKEFDNLSKRYLDGLTSPEEDKLLSAILEKQHVEIDFDSPKRSEIEDRMWKNIQKEIYPTSTIIKWAWISGIAASIFFIISFFYFPKNTINEIVTKIEEPKQEHFEINNSTLSEKEIKLEDGTIVTLKRNSSLRYDKDFNIKKRVVHLKGEAFFNVARNVKKPFFVYANNLVAKVLGTSFRVKAYETDKDVMVIVKTGKVSVYSTKTSIKTLDPETQGMVLTPNQQITFEKQEEKMVRSLIPKPVILLSQAELKEFSFKSTPVSKIFDAIEKAYGVDIVSDDEMLKNCRITTSLTNETLFEKLEVICMAIEANYKVIDAQIIIESGGCN
jgi:transmembrane sensor